MKKLPLLLALLVIGCTPAIIGLSFAAGGMSVGATYEVLDNGCADGGASD